MGGGERYRFLRSVRFFKGLSDEEVGLIDENCLEESFEAGTVIFEEGDSADRFYILQEGEVEVWKNRSDPRPDLLAVHVAGHFFGEMALIDELPRSATVIARGKVRAVSLCREEFLALVGRHASIALAVMAAISSLIRSSNEAYVDDLRKRYLELEEAHLQLARVHEEQLRIERLSTLGKFSSLILHDIRNPISMLKGQIQLIELQIAEPQRVQALVKSSLGEVSRLERLANEFLDYSRGEIRLDLAPTNAHELLLRLSNSIRERYAASGIAVETRIECEESLLLDTERVLRALHNLADNARKAMSGRKGTLTLGAFREDRFLVFEVADTGEGMRPEMLEHVFEPFYSASKGGGTGLGMLIVKNIVEAHGGKVRLESVVDEGTSVFLLFPLPSWVED